MWKVKRMNTARIVVLANAVGAGGIAVEIRSVKPGGLQWQTWPAATASNTSIRCNERPNATTLVPGSIARASMARRGISSSTATEK
jgi:pilus assembly protein CpaB